ncbi:peptide/nickel transport system permease protein [Jatrophihabitans endophyticus]|uniref:Peptide/nickel transport system permease protein n=1 Tax=Jatrophihabitans endophyticus TaxID=1206085 RepID=A0A1M5PGZ7_9ACTN|nr:ABC transporter permease [Jatrophihabitans endophyticus]SHH01094.1 peptide/nickel transport system permease protein [Jatrophihabitans endophyticus]
MTSADALVPPGEAGPHDGLAPGRSPRREGRGDLARYLTKRLAIGVLLVLGTTLIAFLLTQLVPGDPAAANLGQQAINDPAAVAAFREQNGLDRSLPAQYGIYLGHLVQGDLGTSQQSHRPVATDLSEYVPATAELALFAIAVSLVLGVVFGVVAALTRDRWPDQVLRVVSLAGVSTPTFWIALVAFYVFFFKLGWSPGGGRLDPGQPPPAHVTGMYTLDALLRGEWSLFGSALGHLVLPGLVLAIYTVGMLLRFTRASVLEVMGSDYIRAARAKGLPERVVVVRHILRPALVGIITVAGVAFGSLLSGTVLVENIFGWPGIGQYAFRSATNLDLPAIMGVSIVVAVVYIVINIAVDVLYGVIDPRIRLS